MPARLRRKSLYDPAKLQPGNPLQNGGAGSSTNSLAVPQLSPNQSPSLKRQKSFSKRVVGAFSSFFAQQKAEQSPPSSLAVGFTKKDPPSLLKRSKSTNGPRGGRVIEDNLSYHSSVDNDEIRTPSGLGHATSFADLQSIPRAHPPPPLRRPSLTRSRRSSSYNTPLKEFPRMHTLEENGTSYRVSEEIKTPSAVGHEKAFADMQENIRHHRTSNSLSLSSRRSESSGTTPPPLPSLWVNTHVSNDDDSAYRISEDIRTPSGLGHEKDFGKLQDMVPTRRSSKSGLSRRTTKSSKGSKGSDSQQADNFWGYPRPSVDNESSYRISEEIRTPSGLGHAEQFADMQDIIPRVPTSSPPVHSRNSSFSLTHRSRKSSLKSARLGGMEAQQLSNYNPFVVHRPILDPIVLANVFPAVFAFCSRHELTVFAQVSHAFLDLVRCLIYSDINMDELEPEAQLQIIDTLDSNPDIPSLVNSFSWLSICSKPYLGSSLQYMRSLQSLSFRHDDASILSYLHPNARLRSLHLQGPTSLESSTHLSAFLCTQPDLKSLIIPDTFCLTFPTPGSRPSTGVTSPLSATSSYSSLSFLSPTSPKFKSSLKGPNLPLPALSHVTIPSPLASILVPERPVNSISVQICNSIYDGLRPTALMSALAQSTVPVQELELSMTSKIDARTVERLLRAAGLSLSKLRILKIRWLLDHRVCD